MYRTYEMELAGRPLVIEIGRVAELANGNAIVRYGDTVVLCTATASAKPRPGIDFFPLSVDYEEKMYAVGKIPGGFIKREGRPTEKAVLTSRVIDRPMRPLFPSDYRNDVAIVTTVMSVDQDASPEIAAMIGASIVVSISDIPFNGPLGACSIGYADGDFIVNPSSDQRERSQLSLTVSSTREKVMMIEAGANEISTDLMFEAIELAHSVNVDIVRFIDEIVEKEGREKHCYDQQIVDPDLFCKLTDYITDKRMEDAVFTDMKQVRDEQIRAITDEVTDYFRQEYGEDAPEDLEAQIGEAIYKFQKLTVRRMILKEHKRPDGRRLDEIRPLSAEVDILPRTHGSALFKRGQTQVLTTTTLGPMAEVQKLDGLDVLEITKRYMHQYNFPSYSVGETRPSRGPGRREIGHGALAEKSLLPVIPTEEEFPYAIRLVSEVVSSNGSTSQGSVCASSLSLMAAGVPIKKPVAGISVGLVTGESDDDFVLMTDIQGLEDFFGDMDFKVAGTKDGITAIQMDIKIDGLTPDIIRQSLDQTEKARYYILDEVMDKAIDKPRAVLSPYAPKITTVVIDVEKISEVIGARGKTIKRIIDDTGANIDIQDDGRIFISGTDQEKLNNAAEIINAIVSDPEPGKIYNGTVTRLMTFGAFVEIAPEKEGLVHISKMAHERVNKVEDVVNVGDKVNVMCTEIDAQGRINLSIKDTLPKPPHTQRSSTEDSERPPRPDRRPDRFKKPRD